MEIHLDGTFAIKLLAQYAHDVRSSADPIGRWIALDGLLLTAVVINHGACDDAFSS